jgi:toxin FitB
MTILDTNILSEVMKENPEPAVVAWLDSLAAGSVWTTAITVFEIRYGLGILSDGKKRRALASAFEDLLREDLAGRILEFNGDAAAEAAAIAVKLRAAGRPVEVRDVLIAGAVAANAGSTLATRNTKDFTRMGISLIDPWSFAAP